MNERLTVKSKYVENGYTLKALCELCHDGSVFDELGCVEICNDECEECVIQTAFDRLAAYENTGLSPDEINDIIKDSGSNYDYIRKLPLEKMAEEFLNVEWCDSDCAYDTRNHKCEDCLTNWLKSQRSKNVCQPQSSSSEKEYTDTELEELWQAFGDIPMNPETEVMADDFLHFPKGTHREDIWKWFDQKHSKGIHFLLYGNGEK